MSQFRSFPTRDYRPATAREALRRQRALTSGLEQEYAALLADPIPVEFLAILAAYDRAGD